MSTTFIAMTKPSSASAGSFDIHTIISHNTGPLLTFIIGGILSLSIFSLVRDWEQSELQHLFELNAVTRLTSFEVDIIRHHEVVNSLAGLFSSSDKVDRKEFRYFVKDALSRHPDIQGLSWNPLIQHSERETTTEHMHDIGFEDFQFTDLDGNGQTVKAAIRDDYMIVYYIEPFLGNEKAIGFNIASHPGRLRAIQQARDTGEAVISEKVKLVQSTEGSSGYLLFKAVYQKGKMPTTVAERREHFVGITAGVFRFNDWQHTMRDLPPVGIDILVLDQSAPVDEQILFFYPSRTRKQAFQVTPQDISTAKTRLHWQTTIKVPGREWSFLFTPAPKFMEDHQSWQAWIAFASGLSITLLLSFYLFSKAQHTAKMARNNVELLHEIRQRKGNEAELKTQIDFIDTVLDAASNIIAVIDLQGRFVRFNRAAEEFTGYTVDQVLNKPVWELVIPEEQKKAVETVFNHLRNGETAIASQYENEWLTREGGRRLFHWHNSVLFDENGKVSHIVAMGYDITDKKKAELEHQRLQRELQQAHKMESLGQLTGGIAHDFNNLLGVINGYAGLLYEKYHGAGEEKLTDYVVHIKEAGDRAARLVAQMLDFSRSEQVEDKPIQLEPLFKDDIRMLRATLPSSIEINTEIEQGLPDILMNQIHLHQIMMNLSTNARDAMNDVGQLSIKLGWARGLDTVSPISHKPVKGDWIELSVSDTGAGIDSKTASHIFDPFFTTKDVGKGTGMGLSVIYGIMQSHGGHILLDSAPGKGSTFRMLFPPVLDNEYDSKQENPVNTEAPKGHHSEVLVVDDELSLGDFIAELVMSQGYEACYVNSGTKAIELFQANPDRFSMLITDLTMPVMTGTELIEKLRQIRPELPVILCTGNSDNIDASWAADMLIPYFEKPVNSTQLLLKIAELLKKHKQ